MKYIIDNSNFNGVPVSMIGAHGRTLFGDCYFLYDWLQFYGPKDYTILTKEELDEKLQEIDFHPADLFEEIPEKDFTFLLDMLPPRHMYSKEEGVFGFATCEGYSEDLIYCFSHVGKYYKTERNRKINPDQVLKEIQFYLCYHTENDLIYYIIDRETGFTGNVYGTTYSDGCLTGEEFGKTSFLDFRKIKQNPNLVLVDQKNLLFEIQKFYENTKDRLINISKGDFYSLLYNSTIHKRKNFKNLESYFLTSEYWNLPTPVWIIKQQNSCFIGILPEEVTKSPILHLITDSKKEKKQEINYSTYNHLSFDKLYSLYVDYHYSELVGGGLIEADSIINTMSIVLIDKFHEKQGKAYVGKSHPREGKVLTKYIGQRIYCFDYDFIVPCDDPQIKEIQCSTSGWDKVEKLSDRIKELNGIHLVWS